MIRFPLILLLTFYSSWAHAQSLSSNCEDWVRQNLGLSTQDVRRIQFQPVPDAEFFYWMRSFADATPPGHCASTQMHVMTQFSELLRPRWTQFLTTDSLEEFSVEWASMAGSWNGLPLPSPLDELTHTVLPQYLGRIRSRLEQRLRGSPWTHWLPVLRGLVLLDWSPEWSRDLGSPAAAAIDLDHGRVALNIGSAEPAELEALLFHELAHAVDWQAHGHNRNDLLENEIEAWSQTFQFADFLRRRRVELPMLLIRAEQLRRTNGLTTFAEGALRSRGIDTYRP